MYRAYGLLLPGTDFTLDEAFRRLTARLPAMTVLLGDGQVTVETADWDIAVRENADPAAQDESQRIAEQVGVDPAPLAESGRRVEVESDTPDFGMAHFADYLAVIEVLKSFAGLVAVDPKEPSLL